MINSFRKVWLVILAGVLLALPLVWCGFPAQTHDGSIHLNWQECFSRQFWRGELYPRWLSQPNHGFGSPSFFFYPPLPSYVGAAFWRLAPGGAQSGYALGWAAALALILSGAGAFWCLRRFDVGRGAAVLGAVAYMAAPYHLAIDLLDRGANAEFWAFVWLPLVIGAVEALACSLARLVSPQADRSHRYSAGLHWVRGCFPELFRLALVLAGLVATHVLTAMAFAPAVIGFALWRGRRVFSGVFVAGLMALGLTAAYWLPLEAYRPFTADSQIGVFSGYPIETTVFFPGLEWGEPLLQDNGFNRRLFHLFSGFALVYVLALLSLLSLSRERPAKRNVVFFTLLLLGCLLMMLPLSLPIYRHFSFLRYLQFSWRFMTCATVAHSLLAGILLDAFWGRTIHINRSRSQFWLGRAMAVAILGVGFYWAAVLGAEKFREAFLDNGKLRSKVLLADASALDAHGEHLPIRADEAKARRLFPDAAHGMPGPRVVEGTGRVSGSRQDARHWSIEVQATTPCRIIIPQFWFPGWRASRVGTTEALTVRCGSSSGLVEIEAPQGTHLVDLRLSALWPERLGMGISMGTVCCVGLAAAFWRRHKRPSTLGPAGEGRLENCTQVTSLRAI